MRIRIYTVYDHAAGAWLDPFYAATDKMALRSFRDAANNPQHNFYKYPDDYMLACIGEFDQDKGSLHPFEVPELLGTAKEHQTA